MIEELLKLPKIGIIENAEDDFNKSILKIKEKIKPIFAKISVEEPFNEFIYKMCEFDSCNSLSPREFPGMILGKVERSSFSYLAYTKYLKLVKDSKAEINEICLLNFKSINDYYEFPLII